MNKKINFILNNELIEVEINPSTVLLDFIRRLKITGAKEGCKEGDCGACTVLAGELIDDEVIYRSVNSCLIPVMNISGKHVVTIEGLNQENKELNPIQQAFVDCGASQCGFCTPGFIVSLTGHFLNKGKPDLNSVIDSMDGNICRCTGHNSIIRAAEIVSERLKINNNTDRNSFLSLIDNKIIPVYFNTIKERLQKIHTSENNSTSSSGSKVKYFIAGGTDLFVQRPEQMLFSDVIFLEEKNNLNRINIADGYCNIGSTATVTDILESEVINKILPDINKFAELFGSTPIRNSATIGGNINNASPIGDITALFMALNSNVVLSDGNTVREIPLNKYYKSYKVTERRPDEFMESIVFKIPEVSYFFNFEKVSKRTYLDIASVNTAVLFYMKDEIITEIHMSAGGVSAVPLYLFKTCDYLKGKILNAENIKEAVSVSAEEISPISDARGSAEYKSLLLSRLIFTHFITLFPEFIELSETI